MTYPLISEYVAAIKNAADNLDKLQGLQPVFDDCGEPMHSSGAFAVVFKMVNENGKFFALKCFTEEQTGRAEAYKMIAEELEIVNSSYMMRVEYFDKELFVDSNITDDTEFPVLLMDWIEGVTMDVFIADHYKDQYEMSWLCYRFCKMAAWLRSQPFAHGDIKPDNIIVREDGELVLIDYDGMFVPAMKGQKSPTLGTKDFVHPLRKIEDFDETIDDFTLASIALSLKVISLNPSLYDKDAAPDRLLFSAEDYLNISKCEPLGNLHSLMSDKDLLKLTGLFYSALASGELSNVSFRSILIEKPLVKPRRYDLNNIDSVISAAQMGDPNAQSDLAICYSIGRGVNKDEIKAVEWYTKAAEQGLAKAQCSLGNFFFWGRGVNKDEIKAVEWYTKAAEQGLAKAQCNLGYCLFLGKGVHIDKNKAIEWYIKAFKNGDNRGLLELCKLSKQEYDSTNWDNDGTKYSEDGTRLLRVKSDFCGDLIVKDGTVAICDYAFADRDKNVPSDVNEAERTGIKGLTKVVIPPSVVIIGTNAFLNCSNLLSVTIPSSVISIEMNAFHGCRKLTNIAIPYSVVNIGDIKIGDNAFHMCDGLTSITVEKTNPIFDSRNDCNAIIRIKNNELILGCKYTTIPSSVTSIGKWAFFGCKGLKSINIPLSVNSIGPFAFARCINLTNINIPHSVKTIGRGAFYGCINLKTVNLPTGLTKIDAGTFIECSSLKHIIIPDGVSILGTNAFKDSGIQLICMPPSVSAIENGAFANCNSLTAIHIIKGTRRRIMEMLPTELHSKLIELDVQEFF